MKSFFSTGTEHSMTRLSFFMIVCSVLVWESYAVATKTIVPNLVEILAFAGATLGWKQFNERKKDVSDTTINK